MIKLTEQGNKKVQEFISEIKEKREKALSNGEDTADETVLPSEEDIICDIKAFLDEDGDYHNNWGCTDNTDFPIMLTIGNDFTIDGENEDY